MDTGEWCVAYGEVDEDDPVTWAYDALCHSGQRTRRFFLMIQPRTNPVFFCLVVNGVFDLVWDEDVETSEIVDAMENVFWSLEAVMAMGASGYWETLQQDVTERLLAFLSPAGCTGG